MLPSHPATSSGASREDARPEYFAGMEEMLVYFEGVTLAVVNYRCVTCQACVTRECDTRGSRASDLDGDTDQFCLHRALRHRPVDLSLLVFLLARRPGGASSIRQRVSKSSPACVYDTNKSALLVFPTS